MAKTQASSEAARTPTEPSRRDLQKQAITESIALVSEFDEAGGFGSDNVDLITEMYGRFVEAARSVASAFGARVKSAPHERVTLEKAEPADVAAYFAGTGLTRKELASAAGVSTSVIATVQNPTGDRWSRVTFEAKRKLIEAWMESHAAEIKTRQEADAKAAADRQAKIDAKAQRAAAKTQKASTASPKAASTPKAGKAAATSGKKPGRPDKASRAANRKPSSSSQAVASA